MQVRSQRIMSLMIPSTYLVDYKIEVLHRRSITCTTNLKKKKNFWRSFEDSWRCLMSSPFFSSSHHSSSYQLCSAPSISNTAPVSIDLLIFQFSFCLIIYKTCSYKLINQFSHLYRPRFHRLWLANVSVFFFNKQIFELFDI